MDKRMVVLYFLGPMAWLFSFGAVPLAAFIIGFRLCRSFYSDEASLAVGSGFAALGASLILSFVLFRIYDHIRVTMLDEFAAVHALPPREPCEACGLPIDPYDFACRQCGHMVRESSAHRRPSPRRGAHAPEPVRNLAVP